MLRLSGYGLQIRLSGLLQINRECENYAKRIDACSPNLYPHRGAGKCGSHGGTWVWVPVPQR